MAELTEQEVQEMIKKAREGDAEANYRMSEWALEQAVAEPDEERWNRLAAKCLVKAAEAGYEPAKDRMDDLIRQLEEERAGSADADDGAEEPRPVQTSRPAPAEEPEEKPAGSSIDVKAIKAAAASAASAVAAAAGKAAAYVKEIFRKPDDDEEEKPAPAAVPSETDEPAAPAKRTESGGGGAHSRSGGLPEILRFSEWTDAQWKKAQRICLIVCVVLVILILILVFNGKDKTKPEPEPESTPVIPAAETETMAPVQPTATPEVTLYPDETVRAEIEASNLDVKPTDVDYVTEETKSTVKTAGSALNMRKGPDRNYGLINGIPNSTEVEVFAVKGGWALVKYKDDYGWCSQEYLK